MLPEWADPDRRDAALDRVAARLSGEGRWYNRPTRRQPTPAEARLLTCLSHGMDRRGAAAALGLSLETVKTQLVTARRRLAAKTTAHACSIAIRNGWID